MLSSFPLKKLLLPSRQPEPLLTLGIELIDEPGWMGGTLYLRNLVLCLAHLPASERPAVRLLGDPAMIAAFMRQWPIVKVFEETQTENNTVRFLSWLSLVKKKESRIDVVYPGFGAPPAGAITMHWIPDFQHRYLPHLFSKEEIMARDRSIEAIAKRPAVVVLSSNVAKDDFKRFYPDHRAIPHVWHFCSIIDTTSAPRKEVIRKYDLPDKYLYLPNQFWAHKNHITVLKALDTLRRQHGKIIPLVCTGMMQDRRNEAHVSGLLSFIESHDMKNQVHVLGLIDRNDQIEIFRHATAVIQPSLFEGWSTVVEDARAIGRPIFLSDIPVHREQSPEKCFFFSSESQNELADLLRDNWPVLSAGPDLSAEKVARELSSVRILESGRSFCKISAQAVLV